MSVAGTVTVTITVCTDRACAEAGHPSHPLITMTWPDGTVEHDHDYQEQP